MKFFKSNLAVSGKPWYSKGVSSRKDFCFCGISSGGRLMMVLLLGTGLLLTVRAGFPQLTLLGKAWQYLVCPQGGGGHTPAGPVYGPCRHGGHRKYHRGGRGDLPWGPRGGFLDVGVRLSGHGHQVCRGDPGGPISDQPVGTSSWGDLCTPFPGECLPGGGFWQSLYSFFGLTAAFGVGNATQINAVVSGVRQIRAMAALEGTFSWGCCWRPAWGLCS